MSSLGPSMATGRGHTRLLHWPRESSEAAVEVEPSCV